MDDIIENKMYSSIIVKYTNEKRRTFVCDIREQLDK